MCIGARDDSEIRYYQKRGFKTRGIDLYETKLITKCDASFLDEHSEFKNKIFEQDIDATKFRNIVWNAIKKEKKLVDEFTQCFIDEALFRRIPIDDLPSSSFGNAVWTWIAFWKYERETQEIFLHCCNIFSDQLNEYLKPKINFETAVSWALMLDLPTKIKKGGFEKEIKKYFNSHNIDIDVLIDFDTKLFDMKLEKKILIEVRRRIYNISEIIKHVVFLFWQFQEKWITEQEFTNDVGITLLSMRTKLGLLIRVLEKNKIPSSEIEKLKNQTEELENKLKKS